MTPHTTATLARLVGPRELVWETEALDGGALADGTYLAVTHRSAVSIGTERAAWAGDPPLRPGKVYPRLVGYCNVAEVRASRAPGVAVGDLVLTHQSHRSAFVANAADVLARVPAGADAAEASAAYLAHLGLAALRRASFQPGERVAVVGLGAIGLATVALAKAFGAYVTAVGNDEGRLALAREMGADRAVRDAGPPLAEEATAHVVVLTANAWQAFHTSLRLARPWGRIAMLGFPGRTEGAPSVNPLASEHVYDKQLAIFGAGMPVAREGAPQAEAAVLAEGMGLLVGMIADRRLRLAPLVSEVVPWRDLPRVYERAASGDKSLVTAVLDWSAP